MVKPGIAALQQVEDQIRRITGQTENMPNFPSSKGLYLAHGDVGPFVELGGPNSLERFESFIPAFLAIRPLHVCSLHLVAELGLK